MLFLVGERAAACGALSVLPCADSAGHCTTPGAVMAGLVPAIHDFLSVVVNVPVLQSMAWMAATSAAMTAERVCHASSAGSLGVCS